MGVMEPPELPSKHMERFIEAGRDSVHVEKLEPYTKSSRGGLVHTGSVGDFESFENLHGTEPDTEPSSTREDQGDAGVSPWTPPRQGRFFGWRDELAGDERLTGAPPSASPLRTPAGGMLLQHR